MNNPLTPEEVATMFNGDIVELLGAHKRVDNIRNAANYLQELLEEAPDMGFKKETVKGLLLRSGYTWATVGKAATALVERKELKVRTGVFNKSEGWWVITDEWKDDEELNGRYPRVNAAIEGEKEYHKYMGRLSIRSNRNKYEEIVYQKHLKAKVKKICVI